MKVAVSALGPTFEDRLDERFGRAAYLLVIDTDFWSIKALNNRDNQQALEGAGIAAAERVAQQGVAAVVTGHVGPKAHRALAAAGVAGYEGTGSTVREAVQALNDGRLLPLGEGPAHAGLS